MSHSLLMTFEQFEKLKAENEVLQGKLDDALTLTDRVICAIADQECITAGMLEDWGSELRHIKCRKGNG